MIRKRGNRIVGMVIGAVGAMSKRELRRRAMRRRGLVHVDPWDAQLSRRTITALLSLRTITAHPLG